LKKILHSRLSKIFNKFSIISDDRLVSVREPTKLWLYFYLVLDLLKTYHSKEYSVALFLDLQEAFDSVNHQVLLDKLHRYGVRWTFFTLIQSYLTNREQFVALNEFNSPLRLINIGVPQGSVLGPLFFNIFINDIASSFNVNCKHFADDAVFYVSRNSYDETCDKLSKRSLNLSRWPLANKLVASYRQDLVDAFYSQTRFHFT
jgi:retron-type reverse transcriptase